MLLLQKADSGLYECQISTTPVMSHIVSLQVTQPRTIILGGDNIFVEEGDTMNLTCLVKEHIISLSLSVTLSLYSQDSPEPPQLIFWFHNEREISYDSPRGGVSQITEKGENSN